MIVCEILMCLRSLEIHKKFIFNSDGGITSRFCSETLLGRRRTFGGHMRPPGLRLLVEGIASSALERKGFIISKSFEIC